MGRAGKALRQALTAYEISQNQLATTMGIGHANVSRWVNEVRDPGGETILEIREALQRMNPAAAEEFIRLYLNGGNDSSRSD
ncbi:helix-turn-helix transcriptional regulator [Leptolyngbya sp. FACHB-36]|uniref:helix-turn-helix domain-containing protein n=1 Tax=Leptolyngbya sp. FACHB-36 TaxID=2692808 RepID=UPI0016816269|nr:helix-turn-helix transcriptional regulator [Leptolyngbya sp. FACHB-36]MBD2018880.1 helix-turn-helix transcriptional regulator [Leptolyngbya sp. FACHB-36]